jgi:radical SAM superfamily enzyme YgiQ (UPF0313 family)
MKIAIVNVNKSRVVKNTEYHVFTAKAFVEARSWNEISAEIINVYMTDDMSTSAGIIENQQADIVVFRVLYWNAGYILKLAKSCKNMKFTKGLWGYDTFASPEEYFKKEFDFDFIIQDEPELSLYEMAMLKRNGESIGKASGIVFKDKKSHSFVYGENRVITDLDTIPSPYLNGMIPVSEATSVYWEIARGCLFKCDFCIDFSHSGNLRYHSFAYLEKELKFFAEKGVTQISVGCPIANLSHQHFSKILSMINEYLPNAIFEMSVRADLLSKSDIETLADMNIFLNIGLQTTNQKVHENLLTSFNVNKALANIRYMANFPALMFGIDVIAGLPRMSYEDFLNDLEVVFNLWPISINLKGLSVYPGTKIYNRMREFGYIIENSYPYNALESAQFTKKDMEKAAELSDGIDLLYNKGRMVSIITMLAKGLEMPCHEIIMRWNKWIRKQAPDIVAADIDSIEYSRLFGYIHEFFAYIFDRFQKKKLWPVASDLLKHNHFYTTSLMVESEDKVAMPYQLDTICDSTVFGINDSAFFDKFSYDIEDLIDTGYIDLKKYASEVDKEELYGIVYRIDGSVFAKVISNEEFMVFDYIRSKGTATFAELKKKFKKADVLDILYTWCEDGVLFVA